jgi:hypothetical protein
MQHVANYYSKLAEYPPTPVDFWTAFAAAHRECPGVVEMNVTTNFIPVRYGNTRAVFVNNEINRYLIGTFNKVTASDRMRSVVVSDGVLNTIASFARFMGESSVAVAVVAAGSREPIHAPAHTADMLVLCGEISRDNLIQFITAYTTNAAIRLSLRPRIAKFFAEYMSAFDAGDFLRPAVYSSKPISFSEVLTLKYGGVWTIPGMTREHLDSLDIFGDEPSDEFINAIVK